LICLPAAAGSIQGACPDGYAEILVSVTTEHLGLFMQGAGVGVGVLALLWVLGSVVRAVRSVAG
jgi:hypothetical protein